MLFSNSKIANYINNNFEPVWVKVRPVPKVTVDFGNGRKIIRTVTGNIATYICTTDGYTIDILPGIYEPSTYLSSLKQLNKIAHNIMNSKSIALSIRRYHQSELKNPYNFNSLSNLKKNHLFLSKDTENNENIRRYKVHKLLGQRKLVKPNILYPTLYKEVLGLDLSDPYMGLYGMLKANYPFQDSKVH